jgi:hypothetical protein
MRLYSSSLLLVYDGAIEGGGVVSVWMIDFANAIGWTQSTEDLILGTPYPPESIGEPDMGYLLGLDSLIRAFESMVNT